MKLIYIETFGCAANKNNSEILKGLLTQSKYQITNNNKIADILILNTCIVKQKTENKIIRRIQDLSAEFPDKLLVIAGCMPDIDKKNIKKISSNSLLLGTHHIKDIVKLIENHYKNKLNPEDFLTDQKEEKILLPKIPENKLISIIQISEGCLGKCSYCKTRLAKGELYSYNKEKIIRSIESDLQNKAKEIWLTSQDLSTYGIDIKGKPDLIELLKKILEINKKFKLRIGMMNPKHLFMFKKELIELYKDQRIFKFLHIPIQSADNEVLKQMNRGYDIELAKSIIHDFKFEFPDLTIATDLIIGYPTETELTHKLNMEFIEEIKPDMLNISKFSSHKETEAGKLKPINTRMINRNTSELMEIHRKTSTLNKLKYHNKTVSVFIDAKTKIQDIFEGRDENYNIVLINSKDKSVLGKNITVKIIKIGVHHMIGEIQNI